MMDYLALILAVIALATILGVVLYFWISADSNYSRNNIRKFLSGMANEYLAREMLPPDERGPRARISFWLSIVGFVVLVAVLHWLPYTGSSLAQAIYEFWELIVGFYIFCLLAYIAFRKVQRSSDGDLESKEQRDESETWHTVKKTYSKPYRGRWLEVLLGLVCTPLAGLCAVWGVAYTYSYITEFYAKHSFSAFVFLGLLPLALCAFLVRASYRLLFNPQRSAESRLIPPVLMIAFGTFFSLMGIWVLFESGLTEDSLEVLAFGVVIFLIGIGMRSRDLAAKNHRQSDMSVDD